MGLIRHRPYWIPQTQRGGGFTILQQLLERNILWLAYRDHILELVVGAAFKSLFGYTKGPAVTLFKIQKQKLDFLDLSDIRLPEILAGYKKERDELLNYINTKLEPESLDGLPRCDETIPVKTRSILANSKMISNNK